MNLAVSLIIIVLIIYSVYQGSRRGMLLIALELMSFAFATLLALFAYRYVGALLRDGLHVATALGNVAAFVVVWALAELACAFFIHYVIFPRIGHHHHLSVVNRIGGGILGGIKAAAIITLGLLIFDGLPLSAAQKQPVTSAWAAQALMYSSGDLQTRLASGLGRDLGDSLTFFTVPASPEDEKSISLGFTTTNVTVDARDEAAMLVLVNKERTSRGLPALTLNEKARVVARKYSADMFARGFFSHVNPEGRSPFDRMKAGGVEYGSAGENLALAPTVQQAHTGLMNSPGHKANILSREYRTIGIGIVDGGQYGLMVTQEFTD